MLSPATVALMQRDQTRGAEWPGHLQRFRLGAKLEPTGEPGTLAMNPPYGERLMSGDDETASGQRGKAPRPRAVRQDTETRKLSGFYRGLGEMLGRHHGWTALLLSGNPLLLQGLPVKPEIDHRLWNGPLEVHLYRLRVP